MDKQYRSWRNQIKLGISQYYSQNIPNLYLPYEIFAPLVMKILKVSGFKPSSKTERKKKKLFMIFYSNAECGRKNVHGGKGCRSYFYLLRRCQRKDTNLETQKYISDSCSISLFLGYSCQEHILDVDPPERLVVEGRPTSSLWISPHKGFQQRTDGKRTSEENLTNDLFFSIGNTNKCYRQIEQHSYSNFNNLAILNLLLEYKNVPNLKWGHCLQEWDRISQACYPCTVLETFPALNKNV